MRMIGIENPAPGEVAFWDMGPPPEPGPTQVVIETLFTGMSNGLERHALLGEHAFADRFPHRVGHQTVGIVAAAGADVTSMAEGDPVFFGQDVGHRGWHLIDVGANNFAGENSHLVLPLPENVRLLDCALLGSAAMALRAILLFGVSPGDSVWVVGAGLLGQCCAQAARATGATVTVTDLEDVRLALAASCGAHRILDARDEADRESLAEGGPYDFILDTSGDRHLLHRIHQQELLANGGTIGLLALRGEVNFSCELLRAQEGAIRAVQHFDEEDLRIALQLLVQRTLNLEPLIARTVPIDEAMDIYEQLRDPENSLLGVVFDWREGTSEQPAFFARGSLA